MLTFKGSPVTLGYRIMAESHYIPNYSPRIIGVLKGCSVGVYRVYVIFCGILVFGGLGVAFWYAGEDVIRCIVSEPDWARKISLCSTGNASIGWVPIGLILASLFLGLLLKIPADFIAGIIMLALLLLPYLVLALSFFLLYYHHPLHAASLAIMGIAWAAYRRYAKKS